MPATHEWAESNGSGEVETKPIANINFGSNDSAELNTTTYPITRGNASFEKYIRCFFSGVFTEISNMKFWRSDVLGYKTGETLKAAANEVYVQPTDVANADSDIPLNVGSALDIDSAEGDPTIVEGATGVTGYTGYIRLQLHTTGSTPSGSVFQKTLMFQYDEV
jgi:hypothetical protein